MERLSLLWSLEDKAMGLPYEQVRRPLHSFILTPTGPKSFHDENR